MVLIDGDEGGGGILVGSSEEEVRVAPGLGEQWPGDCGDVEAEGGGEGGGGGVEGCGCGGGEVVCDGRAPVDHCAKDLVWPVSFVVCRTY